jgi:hypothetical protein
MRATTGRLMVSSGVTATTVTGDDLGAARTGRIHAERRGGEARTSRIHTERRGGEARTDHIHGDDLTGDGEEHRGRRRGGEEKWIHYGGARASSSGSSSSAPTPAPPSPPARPPRRRLLRPRHHRRSSSAWSAARQLQAIRGGLPVPVPATSLPQEELLGALVLGRLVQLGKIDGGRTSRRWRVGQPAGEAEEAPCSSVQPNSRMRARV